MSSKECRRAHKGNSNYLYGWIWESSLPALPPPLTPDWDLDIIRKDITIAPGWSCSPQYCRLQLTSRNCLVEKEQKLPGGCPYGAVEYPWKLSRVPVKCKWKPAGVPVELSWKLPLAELLKFAGDQFHWESSMPAVWQREVQEGKLRKTSPFPLQCPCTALYWQRLILCPMRKEKTPIVAAPVSQIGQWRVDGQLRDNNLITGRGFKENPLILLNQRDLKQ